MSSDDTQIDRMAGFAVSERRCADDVSRFGVEDNYHASVTDSQPEPPAPDDDPDLSQAEPDGRALPGMAELDALAAGLDAVDATLARLDRTDG